MTETADRPADAGRPTVPLVDDHYAVALPASYRHDIDAVRTRRDITALESLTAGEFTAATETDSQKGRWRFTLITAGAQVPLSAIMPPLQSLGVDVIDQQPYPVTNTAGTPCWIYDFGIAPALALHGGNVVELQTQFTEAFKACWHGAVEVDRLNQLVLRVGLSWNQVAVLRSYVCYLRQAKFPYGGARMAHALLVHPDTAQSLAHWFDATFHPDRHSSFTAHAAASDLQHQIDTVESLEDDRILRALSEVMKATVRTTVYRREMLASNTSQDWAVAHKLTPQIIDIAEFPEPRPRFEVFVYSPRVEGVHLRFGHVARGGLRWSDRRDDYRTEVLGLVKAQAIKNAVIVPLGAKGGFVVKRPHMTSGDARSDRQAIHAEGVECYRQFIAALLDLTDNIDTHSGAVVTPPRVVCLDDADPYLVVAADKGTATFSDAANDIAAQYDYWLGDAFASGGTHGYDHKSMGITARGAWQSVRRHLAEQGRNPDLDDITVVGIGDMSGDVFGNAMLLSRRLKLVAAFDHRHIFIDPHPDPGQSLAERRRLFALPRSSWADYDTRFISRGGGVWPRGRKTIPVSEQAAVALGLATGDTVISPTEMIKAILRAPVDLLFNGGVGTFVKASDEADTAVGDKANDPVRVDAATLRAGIVAEGGNLGVTTAGRVEFARAGGQINNDALDNCAGVSCSDHEVNIKILLADGVAGTARDTLLAEMTDEVAELVLAENRSQNRVLGITRTHAASSLHVHARIIRDLERRTGLNPALEGLPTPREIRRRADNGEGLTSPELAILLAHVKLDVKHDLLASSLTNEPAVSDLLVEYFPQPLRTRHLDRIRAHRLHGEIAATMLANDAIDTGG